MYTVVPVPDELKSELGLDERPYFIDTKTQDGMIFILADPVGKINPRVDPKKLADAAAQQQQLPTEEPQDA